MDLIRRNFGLKAASLVIAVALWLTFNYLTAPQAYSTTLQIPVTLHGVSAGLVAESGVASVTVELAGPRSVLEKLTPADFAAYVDCSGKNASTQSLGISVAGPESDKIRSVAPSSAIVVLDRFGYRTVPVVEADTGQNAVAADIQPKAVVVSGGEMTLARVMAARVSIEGALTNRPVAVMIKPVAVDANFAVVAGVTVAPPVVRVAITPRRESGL